MDKRISVLCIMQKYLPILRKINGWTTEELGKRIGVTKQTISNLENRKVVMTKTQYLALRTVFEYEIRVIDENMVLKRVMAILFYDDAKLSAETEEQLYEALENLSAAATGGIRGNQLAMLATTLLSPLKLPSGVNVNLDLKTPPYGWVSEIIQQEEA